MITTVLRHRFVLAPVLLSSVAKPFSGLEHAFRFYDLVREYLPEEREKLLPLAPADAGARFARAFGKRYFPIGFKPNYEIGAPPDPLRQFTRSIPLEWHALERYCYDSGQIPDAQLLAAAVCACPFEDGGEFCHAGQTNRNGARVVVVERFQKKAPAAVKLLPADGWPLEHIEWALGDSPWPGLLIWCRWLFCRTGNRWLDTTQYRQGEDSWSHENVAELARHWPLYLELDKQRRAFSSWLGHDFPRRSAQVIRYLEEKMKKRPKTLMEVEAWR